MTIPRSYETQQGGTLVVDNAGTVNEGDVLVKQPNVAENDSDTEADSSNTELVIGPSNANLTSTYTHEGSETISDCFTYQATTEFSTRITTGTPTTWSRLRSTPSTTSGGPC